MRCTRNRETEALKAKRDRRTFWQWQRRCAHNFMIIWLLYYRRVPCGAIRYECKRSDRQVILIVAIAQRTPGPLHTCCLYCGKRVKITKGEPHYYMHSERGLVITSARFAKTAAHDFSAGIMKTTWYRGSSLDDRVCSKPQMHISFGAQPWATSTRSCQVRKRFRIKPDITIHRIS